MGRAGLADADFDQTNTEDYFQTLLIDKYNYKSHSPLPWNLKQY